MILAKKHGVVMVSTIGHCAPQFTHIFSAPRPTLIFAFLLRFQLMPHIEASSFLTLHYRLSGPAGDIINTFEGKPATLSLGAGSYRPQSSSACWGCRKAHAALSYSCWRGLWPTQPRHAAMGGKKDAGPAWRPARDLPTRAMWCSSPRLTAWASTPARWCRPMKAECCLTLTTHWQASQ